MAAVSHALRLRRLTGPSALRAVTAGIAWGAIFTTGTVAYAWSSCGIICLDDVAMTAAISMTAGIIAIGPPAAFTRRT